MRNYLVIAIVTLAVVLTVPVRPDVPTAGRHNPPAPAIETDFGGLG